MSRDAISMLAPVRTGVRAADVVTGIAARHGLCLADLIARDKSQRVSAVRQAAMLALWRHGFRVTEIGRVLMRDHTTVLFGIARAQARESDMIDSRREAA